MEYRKLYCDYVQLFPRTICNGLAPMPFFCMLCGCNVEELPMRYLDNVKAKVYALDDATRWWHEYGKDRLLLIK